MRTRPLFFLVGFFLLEKEMGFDDLNRFRLAGSRKSKPAEAFGPPRHKQGQRFLKGPIPWAWLRGAARFPGKALHVAIALWFTAGLTRRRVIQLSPSTLRMLGVERNAARRGLLALEKAGLVHVERRSCRSPIVTLLDVAPDAKGSGGPGRAPVPPDNDDA